MEDVKAEEVPQTEEATKSRPSFEDMATHKYMELLPKFRDKIEELSNRQLKKVTTALMEYPLERIEFQWSYDKEKEAFIMGTEIMDCRFVIIKAALDLKQEEIRQLLEPKQPEGETVIVDQT